MTVRTQYVFIKLGKFKRLSYERKSGDTMFTILVGIKSEYAFCCILLAIRFEFDLLS
ncbi:hypothetical protein Patl1_28610 [Pistacia atlantica]|uniref:Uncharacterized protein n=1 Tax=Pistacia atlantica TaxID=434234 RepID=A0ACC1BBN8_9ROSI|nr:hypothetical protein Patl1_28610 [Pistacia atlantica]